MCFGPERYFQYLTKALSLVNNNKTASEPILFQKRKLTKKNDLRIAYFKFRVTQ